MIHSLERIKPVFVPATAPAAGRNPPVGDQIEIDGESFLRMPEVEQMDPFLMTVVADTDLWLFVGSNGGFTAGRGDADHALFPYRTADKILRQPNAAGALSVIQCSGSTWEPWAGISGDAEAVDRCLYKHKTGCAIRFEETHYHLGLRFSVMLVPSDTFGLVRECRIENLNAQPVDIRMLDGWHGILPPGVEEDTYSRYSYLAAAYMRHELHQADGLGLYTLNCGITDRAEPFESLRASVAWSSGHHAPLVLLSDRAIRAFRRGQTLETAREIRGEMGAYLSVTRFTLKAGASQHWFTVADTGLDHAALARLKQRLADPERIHRDLGKALSLAAQGLERRIAGAGALQHTADHHASIHHFANVLFNCMRGGVPIDGYCFQSEDFFRFLEARNADLANQQRGWIDSWPAVCSLTEIAPRIASRNDPQLSRLAGEYLPLTFSRRHGDPSRPWNRFSIRLRDSGGTPICTYSGNWRDIFQNWESLAHSYPACCTAMISVFLNASTADGYNPYRITREGIDWEVEDPKDPWSHIGYWGDHQIVYLHRLLRTHEDYWPGQLAERLDERLHSYALVPYEIRSFDRLLDDPRHSIRFNSALHDQLLARAGTLGNDGKLLPAENGKPLLVSLAEKLLVPLLVKLTNLVPGGGIWLNTQRPEWNDGNNALAGWGLSVVTICHIHAYVTGLQAIFGGCRSDHLTVSAPVARLMDELAEVLPATLQPVDDAQRRELMERLGRIGEHHREAIYRREPMTGVGVRLENILRLLEHARLAAAATLEENRREDGMFHSYNVLETASGRASVKRLKCMLEGQVAAIASGVLDASATASVLAALRHSELYRPDQHSYLLQPDRAIQPFEERNLLPDGWEKRIPLIAKAARDGCADLIVIESATTARFQADLVNERSLRAMLAGLVRKSALPKSALSEEPALLGLWEQVFHHQSFIGRSDAMFAFEGLGSIYWHMVSKLLLAVQEGYQRESRADAAPSTAAGLLEESYDDIRAGLGVSKSPMVYGAFPTDPYSHSPRHLGAQQPGMTGQVKEEIITRMGELGVTIRDGAVHFEPRLLHAAEFFTAATTFHHQTLDGGTCACELPPGSLAFTLIGVPVIYHISSAPSIRIDRQDGGHTLIEGGRLPEKESRELFLRSGSIARLLVSIPAHILRNNPS